MSFPPPLVSHAADAIARLAQWAKDRPNVLKLLNALNTESQALEVALQDLIIKRYLDTAADDQLDQIGAIVGQPRSGDDDTTYRQRIRARIRINRSSSTAPEIIAIMRVALISLTPVAGSIDLYNEWKGDFVVAIREEQTSTLAEVMRSFLRLSRGGGIRGVLEWYEAPPAEIFTLDVGPGLDIGKLAGGKDAI